MAYMPEPFIEPIIDLDKQNHELEIERAVLIQKAKCLSDRLELINEMRKSQMNILKTAIDNFGGIWS